MKYMNLHHIRTWAAAVAVGFCVFGAMADIPFREHRYDSFRAAPVKSNNIVFFGNSITNMNEWRECFGDNSRIVNRGNSGALSSELVDNVESLIAGRPAKVFILIGTNDLGSDAPEVPEQVAKNIRTIIDRFKAESPKTKVYVQSILPSTSGKRTPERIAKTNELIQAECRATGATYINLFDSMGGITTGDLSYDKLHITARGYKVWCDIIAPYVGVECSYPATFTENNSGLKGSLGMRSTYWSAQEVKPTDVLFIGDEVVHGGEWAELLGSPDVKNRGTQWGYGGISLPDWERAVETILTANPERKQAPRMIMLNIGLNETNSTMAPDSVAMAYKRVIDRIRQLAPTTALVITSQLPTLNADHNTARVTPVNNALRSLAQAEGIRYADLYTPLIGPDGAARPDMVKQNYIYARGYNAIAQVLAPIVGNGAKAMNPADFERHYALIQARTQLGHRMEWARKGITAHPDIAPKLKPLVKEAEKLLRSSHPSLERMEAVADALNKLLPFEQQP